MLFAFGDLDLVAFLLDHGAKLEKDALSRVACHEGNEETIMFLLDRGLDVNTRFVGGSTILMAVAARGHEKCVKHLLEAGVDVDLEDDQGFWAVHAARYGCGPDIIERVQGLSKKPLPTLPCSYRPPRPPRPWEAGLRYSRLAARGSQPSLGDEDWLPEIDLAVSSSSTLDPFK